MSPSPGDVVTVTFSRIDATAFDRAFSFDLDLSPRDGYSSAFHFVDSLHWTSELNLPLNTTQSLDAARHCPPARCIL